MLEVVLKSAPAARAEHIIRVVSKHNRAMTHHQQEALLKRVLGGKEEVIARYVERHSADNVVTELAYHGAQAEVRDAPKS